VLSEPFDGFGLTLILRPAAVRPTMAFKTGSQLAQSEIPISPQLSWAKESEGIGLLLAKGKGQNECGMWVLNMMDTH